MNAEGAACGLVVGGGSNCGSQRDKKQTSKSHIHIAWNRDVLIAHPLLLLSEAPCCIPGVMLNYPQRQFRLSLWLSYSDSLSLPIRLPREHQQCFFSGLHQRVPDSEWPVGQGKPTLLSGIHSHCQGEPLNGRRLEGLLQPRQGIENLFHQWIKTKLWYECIKSM